MTWFVEDTKEKIYWEEVLDQYLPHSKIGQDRWKNIRPFVKGEEKIWQEEMNQLAMLVQLFDRNRDALYQIETMFTHFQDNTLLFEQLLTNKGYGMDLLTTGYHIKQFLWFSHKISQYFLSILNARERSELAHATWYQMNLEPWKEWLLLFSPKGHKEQLHPQFALQDLDNQRLLFLRKNKRSILRQKRALEKQLRMDVEEAYKLQVNLERYLLIPKHDQRSSAMMADARLQFVRHQQDESVFYLLSSPEEEALEKELRQLETEIKREEMKVFSQVIEQNLSVIPTWIQAHDAWAHLEVLTKKVRMAFDMNGTRPILNQDAVNSFLLKKGFHPYFHHQWEKENQGMKPISLSIAEGVTVLFGANMGGKSVVLKTIAFITALAQHGFFVPAKAFHFSFVSHTTIISGDYQNIETGLSSFGAEVRRISQDLSYSDDTLYLLDEIGKGTNPIEGEALTIALLRFLKQKKGICSILVTHFPNVLHEEKIQLYEVKNYQVIEAKQGEMVYEALLVAEKLGLPKTLIITAKAYLNQRTSGGR